MTIQIVVLDGATLSPGDIPWAPVEQLGPTDVYDNTSESQVVERLSGAEVAVTNKVPLRSDTLMRIPTLRLITVTATGYDCVDIDAARERGIPVCNVPTYGTDSVAQFTFALLLELCHHVARHDDAIRAGEWSTRGTFSFWKTPQVELAGLTMGLLGFGRIGRQAGTIANAFGMSVLACDEAQTNPPHYERFGWASAQEIAERSDVVSLHCNLTEDSMGIVDKAFLEHMKPTSLLINAARGALVDEVALADALNNGRIAGAAVDVASTEPIQPNNPLLSAKNCILTPHMAWTTLAARRRLIQSTVENIRAFLEGTPQHVVNGPL